MASVNYIKLFNTRLEHDFYVSGITKDLEITPTIETRLAMKNSNMLYRADDTGFRVLYRVDDSGNPFVDFKDVKLVFGATHKNATEFLNITKLTALSGYAPDKVLYFYNIGSEGSTNLNFAFLDFLKSAIFNYEFPQNAANAGDNGSIIIKNSVGNVVTPSFPDPTQVKANTALKWIYPIDFSNMPSGLYEFETTGNASTITKTVYIDNDLVKQSVFAIIDLLAKNASSSNYPVDREYKMLFARNRTYWKYILVLKSGNVLISDTIDLLDTSSPAQAPYGAIVFTRKNNILVNGIDAVEFTSYSTVFPVAPNTATLPFYETPKKDLVIQKNGVTVATGISSPLIGLVSKMKEPVTLADMTITYVTI